MSIPHYLWYKRRGIMVVICGLLLIGVILILVAAFLPNDTYLHAVVFSFGITLSAGSVVSFIEMIRTAAEYFDNERMTKILGSGMMKIEERRDLEEYYPLMEKAQNVDVVGYSLRGFYDGHRDTIQALSERNDGFRLRIVVPDPESNASKEREAVEYRDCEGRFAQSIATLCDSMARLRGVEIYYINFAPSTMIFRIDGIMYVGPYFVGKASKVTLTERYDSPGWAFEKYLNEFNELCSRGTKFGEDLQQPTNASCLLGSA